MADAKNNDRKDRLSAALRENLKRRKQQLRGRAGQPVGRAVQTGTRRRRSRRHGGDTRGNKRE